MSLLPEPPHKHGTAPKIGVLIINLGTPDAPTPAAVRRYLKEFLSDARVVEIWRPLWWVILHLFVLTTRPKKSAQRYAQIWTPEGSPLKVHTERQTKLLRGYLGTRVKIPIVIDYAMRYGQPAIDKTLAALKAQGCDRILALPLYPQYASSTTATAMDALMQAYEKLRNQPALRSVRSFHDDPAYIEALAHSVSDYWLKHGRPEKLVMSFHGVPRVILERGDPYHCECQKTARLLAEALGLPQEKYAITFQSRFGAAEWLKPYTADVLNEYGKQKLRRIDVVCPGFVSDCLETLEEIAIEGKALFLNAGGGEYHYIPCLNERDDWIHALTDLAARNLLGWVTHTPSSDELERSRLLALAAGAKN